MGYRLSKIYTRTGDDGTTSLDGKNRIAKNSLAIATLGTIDELNCLIGLTLTYPFSHTAIRSCFTQIQHDLFDLGGELCLPQHVVIHAEKILFLEKNLDDWNNTLPPLKEFVLPGGNQASATCHLARAVCRRAERCLVGLNEQESINSEILRYLNRLSDLLFVAARMLIHETQGSEVLWEHERKK